MARICACVRTRTAISSLSSLNVFGSASSSSRLIVAAERSELRITLPLAMYVETLVWPCVSRSSRSAAIGTLFRPPTLIPRRRTRYRVIVGGCHDARSRGLHLELVASLYCRRRIERRRLIASGATNGRAKRDYERS